MKKLSNITESLWSDMQDRNGMVKIRKEDQFNPEYIDFGDNTTVYWAKENLVIDGESRFYFDDVQNYNNNGWRLPTHKEVQELNWSNVDIYWAYGYVNIEFKGIEDGILRIKRDVSSTGFHMWTKDRHERFKNDTYAYGYDNSYHFMVEPWGHINKCYVFLVKDKKKVNESLWSDMQDKNGMVKIRKEDDVNLLDMKDFFEYIKSNYEISKNWWWCDFDESDHSIPIVTNRRTKDVEYIFLDFRHGSARFSYSVPQKFKKILEKKFKVTEIKDEFWIIEPKEKDMNRINEFFIDVIDTIIEKYDSTVLRKKSINESLWSDMQDRNGMMKVRKEDDVNLMDIDTFFEYLKEHYKVDDNYSVYGDMFLHIRPDKQKGIFIPYFGEIKKTRGQKVVSFSHIIIVNCEIIEISESIKDFPNLFKKLEEEFELHENEDWRNTNLGIYPKDGGEVNNSFFLKVIDFIIDNTDKKQLVLKRK